MQLKQSHVNSNILLYLCSFLLFEIAGETSLPYFSLNMYRNLLNFFRDFSEAKLHLKFVVIFGLILFMIMFIFPEIIFCGCMEKTFLKFRGITPSHLQELLITEKLGLWKSWYLKISYEIEYFLTVSNRTSCKHVKNRILELTLHLTSWKNKISRS